MNSFAFVDVETTGLRPGRGDRIIEIAIIGDNIIDFSTPIRLRSRYPGNRSKPAWYDSLDESTLPTFDDIAPELQRRLQSNIAVGHNISFDLNFLRAEFERVNDRVDTVRYIDTLDLSKSAWPNRSRYKLGELAGAFDLSVSGERHRATADAELTKHLFSKARRNLESDELAVKRYRVG